MSLLHHLHDLTVHHHGHGVRRRAHIVLPVSHYASEGFITYYSKRCNEVWPGVVAEGEELIWAQEVVAMDQVGIQTQPPARETVCSISFQRRFVQHRVF